MDGNFHGGGENLFLYAAELRFVALIHLNFPNAAMVHAE